LVIRSIYQIMQVRMKRRMLEELCEAIQEAVQAAVATGGVPALDTEIGYRAIEADLDNNRVLLTPTSTAGQDELLAGTVKVRNRLCCYCWLSSGVRGRCGSPLRVACSFVLFLRS
jgi:hypothetical protein